MRHAALKADNAALALRLLHGDEDEAHAALHRRAHVHVSVPAAEPAHQALLYRSDQEYVDGVMGFLAQGIDAGEPIAVAVPEPRARLLMDRLGDADPDVQILDMLELGRNPARIIPAVLTMLERHGGRTLHYVGESVWPGRSREEMQEAIRHEALINLAWPGAAIRVLCPYDAERLDPSVLRDAQMTHPWLLCGGARVASGAYGGSAFPAGTDNPLPDPPADAATVPFGVCDLGRVRALVAARAAAAGVGVDATDDLVIAVSEIATNAIKYGEAGGLLRVWALPGEVVVQIDDQGHMTDPLVGRHRPIAGANGGIGLWMVNQLCDLVEVRTAPAGTTIRLHTRAG